MTALDFECSPLSTSLREWTERVIGYVLAVHEADNADRVLASRLHDTLQCIRTKFHSRTRDAAHVANQSLAIVCLPAGILELISRKLSLRELMTFSHISRDIRHQLLARPQIWADLNFGREDPCQPTAAVSAPLAIPEELLRRSAEESLALTLWMRAESMHSLWPTMTSSMRRLRLLVLSVDFRDKIMPDLPLSSCPTFWRDAITALDVPAPRLRHISISLTESRYDYGDVPPTRLMYVLYNALPLSAAALSWANPCLETFLLRGVRLPCELAMCDHFRSVTCFDYCQNGPIYFSEVSGILGAMPLLITLGLTARTYEKSDWTLEPYAGSSPGRTASQTALRNLYIAGRQNGDDWGVCAVIPFTRLANVDIGYFTGVETLVAAAWASDSVKRITIAHAGVTIVSDCDSRSGDETIIRVYCPPDDGFLRMMCGCSNLTWLGMNEIKLQWFDTAGAELPQLLALRTLCICLATRADYACEISALRADATGIFTYLPDTGAWRLPKLEQLHITAPRPKATVCLYDNGLTEGTDSTLTGMSVPLTEIVRFVRVKLNFEAPKLAIHLAGLHFVDPDIEVPWTELHAFAETLEICEEPEEVPYMDIDHFLGCNLPSLFADRGGKHP